jgi:hypothetical protein
MAHDERVSGDVMSHLKMPRGSGGHAMTARLALAACLGMLVAWPCLPREALASEAEGPASDPRPLQRLGDGAVQLADALTGGEQSVGTPGPAQPSERVLSSAPLPLDWARELVAASPNLTTDFTIDAFSWQGIEARDVEGTLVVRKGRIEVEVTALRIGRGQLRGRLTIAPGTEPPTFELQFRGNDIDVDDLRRNDVEGLLSDGTLDIDVRLTARGRSVAELASSLDGKLDLLLEKGRARQGDVEEAGQSPLFFLDLLSVVVPKGGDSVTIKCNAERLRIESGIAHEELMLIETDQTLFSGSGTIDLRVERLNLTLTPRRTSRLLGVLLPPIRISGTFANPRTELLPLRKLTELGNLSRLIASPVVGPVLAIGGGNHDCAKALQAVAGE